MLDAALLQRFNQLPGLLLIGGVDVLALGFRLEGPPCGIVPDVAFLHRIAEDAAQRGVDARHRPFRDDAALGAGRFAHLVAELPHLGAVQLGQSDPAQLRQDALQILLGAALGADGQLFRHDVLFPVLHIGGKGDAAVLWFRAAFHFPLEQQSLFIQPFLLCPWGQPLRWMNGFLNRLFAFSLIIVPHGHNNQITVFGSFSYGCHC